MSEKRNLSRMANKGLAVSRDDIKIKVEVEEDPDISYLGKYTNSPKGWYIDRETQIVWSSLGSPIYDIHGDSFVPPEPQEDDFPDTEEGEDAFYDAQETWEENINEVIAPVGRGEFTKFEISFNYQGDLDKIMGRKSDAFKLTVNQRNELLKLIKYAIRDYERMEGLQEGTWAMLCIAAEVTVEGQTFTSGYVCGVEGDVDDNLKEIEREQISELEEELKKFGIKVVD